MLGHKIPVGSLTNKAHNSSRISPQNNIMSTAPQKPSNRNDDDADWKRAALTAIASDELARAELARVKRELEEARAELQWLRDKYGTEPERL